MASKIYLHLKSDAPRHHLALIDLMVAAVLTAAITSANAEIMLPDTGDTPAPKLHETSFAAVTASTKTATSDTQRDLAVIDHQIQITRSRFAQATTELREAKVLAAEKMMEYEAARDLYQHTSSPVNANSMDHTQQRLALAEMGVESKNAKFERLQKKLEELASQRQVLLELAAQPAPPTPPLPEGAIPPLAAIPTQLAATPMRNTSVESMQLPEPVEPQLPAIPLIKNRIRAAVQPMPVLTLQGKVTDVYLLNTELQKLEQHLVTAGTSSESTPHVKAYGTAIDGEIALTNLGANQFFARFVAPVGRVSLIVGVRLERYYRNEIQLEFTAEEKGKEFVLIFDMNLIEQPRALVFRESMIFEQEMFAAHNDY